MDKDLPRLISYNSKQPFIGKSIIINEKEDLNIFQINRIYWINYSALLSTESEHAHKTLRQVIISINGTAKISLESQNREKFEFTLNHPNEGLYIPPMFWKKIKYENPCILLCLASEHYDENDYIRNYEDFKKFQK